MGINKTAHESVDEICVQKDKKSNLCCVVLEVRGDSDSEITLCSKEMAEQLHFMLGQLLEK